MTTLPIELISDICQNVDLTTFNAVLRAVDRELADEILSNKTTLIAGRINLTALSRMTSLQLLELDGSFVVDKYFAMTVQKLPNLTTLKLSKCSQCTLDNSDLRCFSHITWLELDDYDIPLSTGLRYLCNVKRLLINGSLVENIHLSYLESIEHLTFTSNELEITTDGFKYLKNLRYLSLNHTRNLKAKGFKHLSKLEEYHNRGYTNNLDQIFPHLVSLKVLCLYGRRDMYFSLSMFSHLNQVTINCQYTYDSELQYLHSAKIVKLLACHRITDDGLRFLAGKHTVHIETAKLVTDEGIKCLAGTKNLFISSSNFTCIGAGIQWLTGIERLTLAGPHGLVDDDLKHISTVKKLRLLGTGHITDTGIAQLKDIEKLVLQNNKGKITDKSISQLTNLVKLDLDDGSLLTDASISLLTKLQFLKLGMNNKLTRNSIAKLRSLRRLYLVKNFLISGVDKVLPHLRGACFGLPSQREQKQKYSCCIS